MSNYFRQLLLLAVLTVLGFGLFVLLFWAGVGASVTILFYRGVVLALVAAIVTGGAAFWLTRGSGEASLPVAAAALSLSFNICFLVLLPVTVDRSVTVYLLSTIERQQDAGIAPPKLERAFVEGYVVKMGAVDRRIDEQRRSGNITVGSDGKVRLTKQGERFMAVSRLVARLFGTDPRFTGSANAAEPSPSPLPQSARVRKP
jgi:hypothetical protein